MHATCNPILQPYVLQGEEDDWLVPDDGEADEAGRTD